MVAGSSRSSKKREAVTPPELVDRLLGAAGEDTVLVGGQALGFWVQRYAVEIPEDLPGITLDTDFLARSAADTALVHRFAKAIKGTPHFPSRLARTALVGQVELDVSDEEFVNVDVIFKVIGLTPKAILARAIGVDFGKKAKNKNRLLVMHPFDVLRSRLANLYTLREKQNAKGAEQLRMAIDVARAFLAEEASGHDPALTARGRSPVQTLVSELEKLASDDAGRKIAARWGIHVADAIDPSLIPAGKFWERKWPTLQTLMSANYASRFSPPGAEG